VKESTNDAGDMTVWGVGPRFTVLSVGYGAVCLAVSFWLPDIFLIDTVPVWLLVLLGSLLIAVGIPFFFVSAAAVHRAYHAGRLLTGGVYRLCRHPLYASWVVFIVPGVVLITRTWLGLSVPVFMYVLLRILVRKEEAYLESRFGEEYRAYRARVPAVFPLPNWGRRSR
jgi:protein-S-isoprenylcysteine O-methyltransferase Ste14